MKRILSRYPGHQTATVEVVKINRRLLKYLQISSDDEAGLAILRTLIDEASQLSHEKSWSLCIGLDKFYDLFGSNACESKSIRKLLAGSTQVWLLAVTLGSDLENRSREYFARNESFRGYVMDRLGSYAVDGMMQNLDGQIALSCEKAGMITTHRFSPGYGDFPLEAQGVFYPFLKDIFPGLRLNRSRLFLPEKTVTAIKGALLQKIADGAAMVLKPGF